MNVRIKHDMHFTAGIYYNDRVTMNNYSARLWMTTNTANQDDQNTAFERIKYFVYAQLDSTVFINQTQSDHCAKLTQAGFDITTMPGDPVDQLVGIMLYYKLNAITEDRMIIVETELSSSQGENITYLHSDMENSIGYVQPPWWTTADPVHSDFGEPGSEKVLSISQNTAWRDLELNWSELSEEDATGNVVMFADFKRHDETE